MNRADAEEYTQSLGQIIGGSWRQVHLARKLGVPAALGMSTEQWVGNLGGYVRLSMPERQEAVLELKAEGLSQRETAEVLGVDAATVNRDLKSVANATVSTGTHEKSEETGVANATVPASAFDPDVSRTRAHVANNSGEIEWYTPAIYIEAAINVMGGIDLDPASSTQANQVIKAAKFFDADMDGLTHPWKGRVWMNPPYAAIMHFCRKLLDSPAVTQAIVLTNNATETQWFHLLANRSDAICFHLGRIKFWRHNSESFTPLQGQVFFYFGPETRNFKNVFSEFGLLTRR